MLKVEPPKNRAKRQEQIRALKYEIANDTCEKDREIHKRALRTLILTK